MFLATAILFVTNADFGCQQAPAPDPALFESVVAGDEQTIWR